MEDQKLAKTGERGMLGISKDGLRWIPVKSGGNTKTVCELVREGRKSGGREVIVAEHLTGDEKWFSLGRDKL